MPYQGAVEDFQTIRRLGVPKRVPCVACSEEFDVKWYGKYCYEELCQDGDKIYEVWKAAIEEFDYDWAWVQVANGSLSKVPLAQESVGSTPTDRGKKGCKKLLVDAHGIPLSIVVTGANQHDSAVLEELFQRRVVPFGFDHCDRIIQNLCLDAGYVGKAQVVNNAGMMPHIRSRIFAPEGEEKKAIELYSSLKDGLWRLLIHGSIVFGKFIHDMRKPTWRIAGCFTWQQP